MNDKEQRNKEQRTHNLVEELLNTTEDKDIDLTKYGVEPDDLLNYFKRLGEL
jgi:hypothetical protein